MLLVAVEGKNNSGSQQGTVAVAALLLLPFTPPLVFFLSLLFLLFYFFQFSPLCFSLFSPLYLFLFFLSIFFLPLKLGKSGVSIPLSSLFFTFPVISSFSSHVLLSIISLSVLFFFHLSPLFLPSISLVPLFITVKGGERTTTPIQSWHRGREVEQLLGSRSRVARRACPFCFFRLGKSRLSVFGRKRDRSSVVGEEKPSSSAFAR